MDSSSKSTLLPMARKGNGSKGQKIHLLTNHFEVHLTKPTSQYFFHYDVAITYEDGSPVEANGIGRKILDNVEKNYQTDLGSKHFAYDGEKNLFTVGPLPSNQLDFTVVLVDMYSSRNAGNNDGDSKRLRRPNQSKNFKVSLTFAAKIPVRSIANALQGKETDHLQDSTRVVLDVILRHNAAGKNCLLVRQSSFHNDAKFFTNIGEGVDCLKGFHASFRTTQGGLSLNIDVTNTLTVTPGPVLEFLITNQGRDGISIDWKKAKSTLRNLRIKVVTTNLEYKITGLSGLRCKDQTFLWKRKKENGEVEETEITVFDYFTQFLKIKLYDSGDFPCINVGKPKRPTYIPIEHCELVSLQRYTKALSIFQRTNLVNKSRQRPREKMNMLTNALESNKYNDDSMLKECGVRIGSEFTRVEGRILPTPNLKVGNGADIFPRDGRWNFNNKHFAEPATVTKWAVVNFSAHCDPHRIVHDLVRCGRAKGINMDYPFETVFKENPKFKNAPASVRVEKMVEQMTSGLPGGGKPNFILCILSQKKNSDVYGPWKKKILVDYGIVTQCIAPAGNVNDQYLTNVLLKINVKLGGLNSVLAIERSLGIPLVMRVPTIIIGMDVSHGSPGQSDVPSIAAVVSSREWPLISKYRACVRTQSPKVELIDNLFNPVSGTTKDDGIMRELLNDFRSCSNRKPEHIIIFRDGVGESQFKQVLNIELAQMMQACKFLDDTWDPKFTMIIAQKNHHTKFFQADKSDNNVPPGTIIDSKICHPHNNDFFLCAHRGSMGTTRPVHYHVLYDEIGFSTDELQELVHSLSYVYQRSTTAVSLVAPVYYAHLAAAQMGTVMKSEDLLETLSSHDGVTTSGAVYVPPMPKLNERVATSMFFC
ncbi:unnamed protein product [Microthlaspi erraticum]|uniref:Uncharacterized protein n=1 Tax=Microthlaspi erraticum TaxID=1685480 RepID=A0A6D2L608_9BRAS|nr:unnamed protein product [Microthlaspi erraticum]